MIKESEFKEDIDILTSIKGVGGAVNVCEGVNS